MTDWKRAWSTMAEVPNEEKVERFFAAPRSVRMIARGLCAAGLPFILVIATVGRFFHELKNCLWHTRQEWRIQVEEFRSFWRDTSPKRRRRAP